MTERRASFVVAVVDDDRRMREALEDLLESDGHAVRVFATAAAFLESGSLEQIDCLICDIDLPDIDGFALLRRAHASRPDLPVILVTGHPALAKRSPSVCRGHFRVFKKPFDCQALLAAVADARRSMLR